MTTFTIKIAEIGHPDKNGVVYTKKVCEKIIKDSKKRHVIGGIGSSSSEVGSPTHEVLNFRIEDDFLLGDVKPFRSADAEMMRDLLNQGLATVGLKGSGFINTKQEVVKFDLQTINLINQVL